MHANYSRVYGGPPRRDQSWHEVLAMARQVGRFDARARLIVRDGMALAQPVGEKEAGIRGMQLHALRRAAGEVA